MSRGREERVNTHNEAFIFKCHLIHSTSVPAAGAARSHKLELINPFSLFDQSWDSKCTTFFRNVVFFLARQDIYLKMTSEEDISLLPALNFIFIKFNCNKSFQANQLITN